MESVHDHSQLTGLALVVLAALGCGMAMQRFRQPAVAGYILAGMILGPSGASFVENRDMIQQLAELGVLMLLFLIGMELSLRGARQVWGIALAATGLQIAVSLLAMFIFGQVLDWPLPQVLLLGFVVAVSSTAVAIKMLQEIGELRTRIGQITIGVLIAQDLAVVPMMLIIGSFGPGGSIGIEAVLKIVLSIVFLVLLIIYLSGRQRMRLPFARLVGKSADLTPLAGLAFCFGAAAISGVLGLSPAYGAFLAGLVIGNSTSRRVMIHYTAPIQSVLLMAFFLSIGLLIDLEFIWANVWTVVLIVAFIALFKTALNVGLLKALGETWPRAFLSGVLLAQIGEFSFILAALAISSGAVTAETHRLIVSVTVLSLIVSPFWLETARRLNRIVLIGVTSPREMLRLTFGREVGALFRSTRRAEHRMVDMATGATRWVGDIMPQPSRSSPMKRPKSVDLAQDLGKPVKGKIEPVKD
ncbi:MAG: cation:proton antiporter [Kiloniellales bacterium]|nr:cation:proton antiporter [Kiloniellales bacterium]